MSKHVLDTRNRSAVTAVARAPSAQRHTSCAEMAEAVDALAASPLAPPVTAKAKLCLIDFLACALTARDLPASRQAIEQARSNSAGASRRAPCIIGTRHRVSPQDAAFANAVLGHGLVRDDMHLGSVSHLGVVVMPTVLALAPQRAVSGSQLLAAIAAGYEAGGRAGRMIVNADVAKIFRPTGISGPFAAAAAAAKLLGANTDQLGQALAIAANTVAGYNEWAATGGSEMFFQAGFAARNGLTAAQLAVAGARASASALEGPAGLLAAFAKPVPAPRLPGAPEILAVFFKEVPACNFAQSAAQAAREIAAHHALQIADIERITVKVPAAAARYPGCDYRGPFDQVLQAKMSIQYNVAASLRTGDFREDNYRPPADRELLRLAALTSVTVDDGLTAAYPGRQGAEVIVESADGSRLQHALADVAPASDALVVSRFEASAREVLGPRRSTRILRFIDALESAADVEPLGRLLAGRNED